MVSTSELILEEIKEQGGEASVSQIYGRFAKVEGTDGLSRTEKGVIRAAISRLKKLGRIERHAPEVYKLTGRAHGPTSNRNKVLRHAPKN